MNYSSERKEYESFKNPPLFPNLHQISKIPLNLFNPSTHPSLRVGIQKHRNKLPISQSLLKLSTSFSPIVTLRSYYNYQLNNLMPAKISVNQCGIVKAYAANTHKGIVRYQIILGL